MREGDSMKIIALTGAGISKSAGIPTFEEVEQKLVYGIKMSIFDTSMG